MKKPSPARRLVPSWAGAKKSAHQHTSQPRHAAGNTIFEYAKASVPVAPSQPYFSPMGAQAKNKKMHDQWNEIRKGNEARTRQSEPRMTKSTTRISRINMSSNRGSYGCETRAEFPVLPLLGTPMSLHAGRVAKLNQANFELLKVQV